jgi:hypothetical protein
MKLLRVTVLGLACALPALGFGQWQWVDKDGRKVFSDQAPPPDVPAKSIIKQPGAKSPAAAAEPLAAAASQAKPAAPKLSGSDPQLSEKKKQAEAAEATKKKADEEAAAKAKAENCEQSKRTKASLDSGLRIARMNARGEREYLDDAARATETKRLQGIIATECKVAAVQ